MYEKQSISNMPKELKNFLQEKGFIDGKTLVFCEADMEFSCEFRHHIIVLSENTLLMGKANSVTVEFFKNKGNKTHRNWNDYSFESYSLNQISSVGIDNLVVGGVLRVCIDGVDRPLCAFTNAYKNKISRLCEVLNVLLSGEELNEEILFDEIRISVCKKCGERYLDKEHIGCPKCTDKRKIFFRLGSFFKPYKLHIAIMCIMSLLSALMSAVWPYLSGSILYDGILGKDRTVSVLSRLPIVDFTLLLLLLVITMVVCKLLNQLFGVIQGRLVAGVVPKVVSTIKNKVFGSIQGLSVSFFTGKRTGGLMTRITADAGQVSDIFIDGIPYVLPNVLMVGFSFTVMFITNWVLAIVAAIALPITAYISIKLQPIMWHYNSKQHQTNRDYRARVNDNLVGTRVVKAFGMEATESDALNEKNNLMYDAMYKSMRFDVKFSALYELAKGLTAVLVWGTGVCFVLSVFEPKMNYGELVTFTGYVSLLAEPATFFLRIFRWWSSSMNSAQRIFEIIDANSEIDEVAEPVKPKSITGNLELKNVTFGYEENREVIKDVSFTVESGKILGIVGRSGAGKTTLANLISRLYDVNSGHIYIDGVDIQSMDISDIRKAVALVSQETYIFRGTVFENIAYANPNADKKSVLLAAIEADAHDFICKLPDGYDTIVGEGERSLSGGEKQRISIARAILANPKILILDEATAAVDTETERKIQTALEKLTVGRTTLSIAHRISTLRNADNLIVIEDGRVIEQGTHKELILKKGTYYKLVQIQNEALKFRKI